MERILDGAGAQVAIDLASREAQGRTRLPSVLATHSWEMNLRLDDPDALDKLEDIKALEELRGRGSAERVVVTVTSYDTHTRQYGITAGVLGVWVSRAE